MGLKLLSNDELLDQLEGLNWCYRQLMSEIHTRAEREQLFPSPLMNEAMRRIRGYELTPKLDRTESYITKTRQSEIDLILSELEL